MKLMVAARAFDDMAGGVERMAIDLMNEMVARGHEVDLLTWDRAGSTAFYPMTREITWRQLDIGNPQVKAGTVKVELETRGRWWSKSRKGSYCRGGDRGSWTILRVPFWHLT